VTPADRQAMREALRSALGTGDLPDATAAHPGVFRAGLPSQPTDYLARFTRELQALAGHVYHASSPAEIAALVDSLARREGNPSVLAWDDEELPVAGVREAIESRGCRVIHQRPGDSQDPATVALWASATVGLTSAKACLAETGSLVVISGPGRGRLASLLTPIHVALVTRASLRRSLPDLLAAQPELATTGANLVCITGPSRTADIEHTLSRGVHGPREIHVVFVD
jgi:L-lactate dehydrogenase complex protein LldG